MRIFKVIIASLIKVIIHFVKDYNTQNAEVFWSLEIEEGTAFPLEGLVAANGYELTVTLDILT